MATCYLLLILSFYILPFCNSNLHNSCLALLPRRMVVAGTSLNFFLDQSRQTSFFMVVATSLSNNTEIGEPCMTPNEELATCLSVVDCRVIYDAILSNKTEGKEFARQSQCGYHKKPLVCCGSSGYPALKSKILDTDVLPNRDTCGHDYDDERIIFGEEAGLTEFPWMAALEYINRLSGTKAGINCGGTVITTRYVVTAAHCIVTFDLELVSVSVGEWKISTDPDCDESPYGKSCNDPVQKIGIEGQFPHPLYNPTSTINDIGLLRMASDIKFSEYVRPICLASPDAAEIPRLMTVAGWGITETGQKSDIKMKAELPILPNQVCKDKLHKPITSNQLCAGGLKGKDSCRGDSGGPLMAFYSDGNSTLGQWFLEGVVSWGVGCGLEDYPAVYTRVSAYFRWIVDVISLNVIVQSKFSVDDDAKMYFPTENGFRIGGSNRTDTNSTDNSTSFNEQLHDVFSENFSTTHSDPSKL